MTRQDAIKEARELLTTAHGCKDDVGKAHPWGEVWDMTEQRAKDAVEKAEARIERLNEMTDAEWDKKWQDSGDEVVEADHPKHSILR